MRSILHTPPSNVKTHLFWLANRRFPCLDEEFCAVGSWLAKHGGAKLLPGLGAETSGIVRKTSVPQSVTNFDHFLVNEINFHDL